MGASKLETNLDWNSKILKPGGRANRLVWLPSGSSKHTKRKCKLESICSSNLSYSFIINK